MIGRSALRVITILILAAGAAAGQGQPASTGSRDLSPVLKAKLRDLVTAEEKYWGEHGTYTTDVSALGLFGPKAASDSVWVEVVQAGGRSWWGRSVHSARKDLSCAIYVGLLEDFTAPPSTDATKVKARQEGAPVCDPF